MGSRDEGCCVKGVRCGKSMRQWRQGKNGRLKNLSDLHIVHTLIFFLVKDNFFVCAAFLPLLYITVLLHFGQASLPCNFLYFFKIFYLFFGPSITNKQVFKRKKKNRWCIYDLWNKRNQSDEQRRQGSTLQAGCMCVCVVLVPPLTIAWVLSSICLSSQDAGVWFSLWDGFI